MMFQISTIVAISILAGQIIKIPLIARGSLSLLDVTILMLTVIGILKAKLRFKNLPLIFKSLSIFLIICLLSLILSPLSLNLQQYLNSSFYIVRLLLYALFFLLFYFQVFGQKKGNIIDILLYSGIGLAVLGLLQFLILPDLRFFSPFGWDPHFFRTVSTFLDPNFAGGYFVLTLLLLQSKSNLGGCLDRQPRVYYSIFAITYLALLTTFSRSSYGMFLISFSALSFLKKSWKLQFITVMLFALLMLGFSLYTKEVSTPRNIDRTQSAQFRYNSWQQGLTLFQKFPVLGVGFNAYRFGIKELNLGDEQFLQSHGSSSNDSSLLFVASTTGSFGLMVFIFFLFSIIKSSYPKNPLLSSALLGLLFHSFFANSLFYPPIMLWILLMATTSKK